MLNISAVRNKQKHLCTWESGRVCPEAKASLGVVDWSSWAVFEIKTDLSWAEVSGKNTLWKIWCAKKIPNLQNKICFNSKRCCADCYENYLLDNFGEWLEVCEAIFCCAGWYNCSLWLLLTSLWMHKRKFTNKARFEAGFSERLKLKDNAVPTILDPTVMLRHISVSNCFYYDLSYYCFVCYYRLFDVLSIYVF